MFTSNIFLLLAVIIAFALIFMFLKQEREKKQLKKAYLSSLEVEEAKEYKKSFSFTFFATKESQYALFALIITIAVLSVLQLPIWFSFICIVTIAPLTWYFVKSYYTKKMREAFNERFPESIDSFIRAIQAGIPLNTVLASIGEMYAGELGDRFSNLSHQLDLGIPMREALVKFSKDLESSDIDFFCAVISLHRETGASLLPMLESLSEVLRERKAVDRKLKALTAETRGAATVLCALPIFVIGLQFVINPSQMTAVLADPTGKTIFAYCLASMVIGFVIIRRMSRMME